MSEQRIAIEEIIVKERYRKDLGDLDRLAGSIRDSELLQPIVLNSSKELIAGQRRLEAVKSLGWKEVPCRVCKTADDVIGALLAERDENTCRKPFKPSEAVAIGKAIEELEREEAKKRKTAGLKKGKASPVVENCPNGKAKGKARDKIGAAVGMSGKNYEKAKAVVKEAEENPAEFGPVKEEMDRTGKVDPAYKKVRAKKPRQAKEADLQKFLIGQAAKTDRSVSDFEYEFGTTFIRQENVREQVNPDSLKAMLRHLRKARSRLDRVIGDVESACRSLTPAVLGAPNDCGPAPCPEGKETARAS
jgi:ParB-like chromosome segregation protein Spo0J